MESGMLKEAMKRRRGKGVDIQLIIDGEPHDVVPSESAEMAHSGLGNDEDPEEKLMDLAPEVKDLEDKMPGDEEEEIPSEAKLDMDAELSSHGDLPLHKKMMAKKAMMKK